MGQSDDDKTEPSLELPALRLPGLGRRRKATLAGPSDHGTPPTTPPRAPAAVPAREPGRRRAVETFAGATTTADRPERARVAARSGPRLSGRVAAAVTGAVVGFAGVLLTFAAMRGCEAVGGTSSCGGPAGFFLLVAIVAVMVLLGSVLLKAFAVADAGSTSFLAVGIVAVVTMLVLLDMVFSAWTALVLPVLGAAAYLLAHWVTTRFEDEPARH
ncbi:hypothetical protein K1X13_06030 [Nocardioides sp. WL0053]|uniref:Integral membrane protein n=1 Tax=Nocardioides jiangsuensis TaxID=2866161 RepID=A0ABS7RH49_9ACTN|nr:hypothetical protein [Nocardioides jiangsuensis]MBY9074373.1 hypothetical protein [Nocardioides jiangsuensis]